MRCCLETVGNEYEDEDSEYRFDKPVAIGAKSKCTHCNESFTLVEGNPYPIWKPDWKIEVEKKKDSDHEQPKS